MDLLLPDKLQVPFGLLRSGGNTPPAKRCQANASNCAPASVPSSRHTPPDMNVPVRYRGIQTRRGVRGPAGNQLLRRCALSLSYLRKDLFFSKAQWVYQRILLLHEVFCTASKDHFSLPQLWAQPAAQGAGVMKRRHRERQFPNQQPLGKQNSWPRRDAFYHCDAECCGSARYCRFSVYKNCFFGITSPEI